MAPFSLLICIYPLMISFLLEGANEVKRLAATEEDSE